MKQTSSGSAVGKPKKDIANISRVLHSMLALHQPSVIVIARCHAQIFVGVVMYIGAYYLLSAYYLFTYCYKCMRLLTRFYSMYCFCFG